MYVTLLYLSCDKVNAAYLRQKTPKIRAYSAKVEPRKQMKAVLCVLPYRSMSECEKGTREYHTT